jgi:hypothetical protein
MCISALHATYRPVPVPIHLPSFPPVNEFAFIGLGLLSDMGCVYTLGHQPGTVVSNNVCHDVESFGYGGWGM